MDFPLRCKWGPLKSQDHWFIWSLEPAPLLKVSQGFTEPKTWWEYKVACEALQVIWWSKHSKILEMEIRVMPCFVGLTLEEQAAVYGEHLSRQRKQILNSNFLKVLWESSVPIVACMFVKNAYCQANLPNQSGLSWTPGMCTSDKQAGQFLMHTEVWQSLVPRSWWEASRWLTGDNLTRGIS